MPRKTLNPPVNILFTVRVRSVERIGRYQRPRCLAAARRTLGPSGVPCL